MDLVTKLDAHKTESGSEVERAVQTLLSAVNNISGSSRRDVAETIYFAVAMEHRTNQQAFWSAILLAMMKYADESTDARNEQSVMFAKRVRELAREYNVDMGFRYL